MKVCSCERRIDLLSCLESLLWSFCYNYLSVRKVVCRDTLAPPELARDAPVAYILHPVTVCIAVFVRNQLYISALDRLEGILCKCLHLEEPLHREPWLDDCVCPL